MWKNGVLLEYLPRYLSAAVFGWPTVLLGPEPESRLMRDEARRGVILPAGPSAIPHEGIINEVEIYVHEDAPTLGAGMRIQVRHRNGGTTMENKISKKRSNSETEMKCSSLARLKLSF